MHVSTKPTRAAIALLLLAAQVSSTCAQLCNGVEILVYPQPPNPPTVQTGQRVDYNYEIDIGTYEVDSSLYGIGGRAKRTESWIVSNLSGGTWVPALTNSVADVCWEHQNHPRYACNCANPPFESTETDCSGTYTWSEIYGGSETPHWLEFGLTDPLPEGSYSVVVGPTTNAVPGGTIITGLGAWGSRQNGWSEPCTNYPSVASGQSYYKRISMAYTSAPPAINVSVPYSIGGTIANLQTGTPSIVNSGFNANSDFHFEVRATSTNQCTVYASTNLSSWAVLGYVSTGGGVARFTDGSADSFGKRFYRVKQGTNCSAETVGFNRFSKPGNQPLQLAGVQFQSFGGSALANVFESVPAGSSVYQISPTNGTWSVLSTRGNTGWSTPSATITAGAAHFIGCTNTIEFVLHGIVVEEYPVKAGYSAVASPPHAEGVVSDFEFPAEVLDSLTLWDISIQDYDGYTYLDPWDPTEPSVSPSQGFIYYNSDSQRTWSPLPTLSCP